MCSTSRVAIAATLALAAFAHVARSQTGGWPAQAEEYLKRAAQSLVERGYRQTNDVRIDSLSDHDTQSFTITLHAGTTYALVGVCDHDCNDLDLVLYDADDREIDSDIESDDVPIVQVTPAETKRYRVKVVMAACTANPCRYGIGIFGR